MARVIVDVVVVEVGVVVVAAATSVNPVTRTVVDTVAVIAEVVAEGMVEALHTVVTVAEATTETAIRAGGKMHLHAASWTVTPFRCANLQETLGLASWSFMEPFLFTLICQSSTPRYVFVSTLSNTLDSLRCSYESICLVAPNLLIMRILRPTLFIVVCVFSTVIGASVHSSNSFD